MAEPASHASGRTVGRRIVRRIVITAASVVAALLIGEALVFVLHRESVVLFPRHLTDVRYGGFHVRRNVPRSSYRHKSVDGAWEFTINGNGFRDKRDFAYEKPEGTRRVLVLGDSYTIGYEAQQHATYAAILGRYLRGKGFSVEILNAGMAGSSSAEELIFLEQEGVRYNPDFIVLGFCGDDFEENVRTNFYKLRGGELELSSTEYIPGIRVQNRLNAIGFCRWLGENSWLVAYLNGLAADRSENAMRERSLASTREHGNREGTSGEGYMADLARALVGKMCATAHEHGAELILLDIPARSSSTPFPWVEAADLGEIADVYIDSSQLLTEYMDLTDFAMPHGSGHWTPFVHVIVGVELGRTIVTRSEIAAQSEAE